MKVPLNFSKLKYNKNEDRNLTGHRRSLSSIWRSRSIDTRTSKRIIRNQINRLKIIVRTKKKTVHQRNYGFNKGLVLNINNNNSK